MLRDPLPRPDALPRPTIVWLLALLLATGCLLAPSVCAQTPAAETGETVACNLLVEEAMEHLITDQYREALSAVERAFGLPEATPECQAYCLQTRSCAFLRMGERDRAVQALAELLGRDPNAPYDGRRFPPAMNRLFRAVRDSLRSAGTLDIGTVAVLDFSVLNPGKYRYEDYDYDALGRALQMIVSTDLVEGSNLTVVDRTNMQDVLAELELTSNRELVNQENAIRLGQLLNAHAFIDGQIVIFEKERIRIDVQIIHAATTRVLSRHYEGAFSGEAFDLLNLQRGVLGQIVEALNTFRDELHQLGPIVPDPAYFDLLQETRRGSQRYMEIWLKQGAALAKEDAGDLKGAIKIWDEIQVIDPDHKLARGRAWALRAELEG